jgi:hypothetical protein
VSTAKDSLPVTTYYDAGWPPYWGFSFSTAKDADEFTHEPLICKQISYGVAVALARAHHALGSFDYATNTIDRTFEYHGPAWPPPVPPVTCPTCGAAV